MRIYASSILQPLKHCLLSWPEFSFPRTFLRLAVHRSNLCAPTGLHACSTRLALDHIQYRGLFFSSWRCSSGINTANNDTSASASVVMPKTDPIDKIDLRVGFITSADKHPDADKLYVLSVDLGEFDLATSTKKTLLKRTIVSGLVDYYLPDELVGRKVVVFANMKPRKLRGVLSQGMLLAASNSNNGSIAVEILEAPRKSRPGDRVVVSNAQQSIDGKIIAPGLPALEKPLVKKQKVIDAFISGLALDACVAKYNGHSLVSESGGNVSTKSMLSGTVG